MQHPFELTGTSAVVQHTAAQVERAAEDDRGVLITAELGLEGGAVALAVHERSDRAPAPFVALACGAVGARELERALFGRPLRSRTGIDAVTPASALYRARGGTLFLEQPGDLPDALQRRLARVLRDGEVLGPRRSGAIALDVRLIASVEHDPGDALRDELLRRLPLRIEVPPLRLRRGDVPAIAQAMLMARTGTRRFTPAALTVLGALPWRRNLAELEGLIERLAATAGDEAIRQEDVLAEVQLDRTAARPAGSLREARRQFEKDFIGSVLRDHDWQMRDAAKALGIERANLYRKARQLGIPLRGEPLAVRSSR